MKSVLNKILLLTMIIAFMWVIVGDLVNMHVKLIYKTDLNKHNTYYTKANKSEKKDYILSSKDFKKLDVFSNTSNNNFNFKIKLSFSEILITKTERLITNRLISSLLLRGPPTLV